jgi:flagellum-specific peptidoglycan hydrolase FlgJ
VVENPNKSSTNSRIKISLDFLVEKPHTKKTWTRATEAGPTMAADEEEEEYARLTNESLLAGNARDPSAQIIWDARMEDFMLEAVVLLGAYTGGTEAKQFKTQLEGFEAVLATCQSNAFFDVERPKLTAVKLLGKTRTMYKKIEKQLKSGANKSGLDGQLTVSEMHLKKIWETKEGMRQLKDKKNG